MVGDCSFSVGRAEKGASTALIHVAECEGDYHRTIAVDDDV